MNYLEKYRQDNWVNVFWNKMLSEAYRNRNKNLNIVRYIDVKLTNTILDKADKITKDQVKHNLLSCIREMSQKQ